MNVSTLSGDALQTALREVARRRIEVFGDCAYRYQGYRRGAFAPSYGRRVIGAGRTSTPLDKFWNERGCLKAEGTIAMFRWKDFDREQEVRRPMQFWVRDLA